MPFIQALSETLPRGPLPCPLVLWQADEVPHAERALARGEIVRVRHGVYAAAADWHALRPWQRYLARVHAVARRFPDALFSHESAAALLGMPVIADPVAVHTLVPPSGAARDVAGIRTHRSTSAHDVVAAGGLLMTSPGATAVTLARHRHPALGLAAADAALSIDPHLTPGAMRADNETRLSSRGRNIARWALDRATGRSESVLESISVATVEWLGFPPPELQRVFVAADGRMDRGDLWWDGHGLLGEPDGEFKYDGRFGDPAALLRARRERDLRLLAGGVRAVAHWGWIEVARVDPLRALLLGHGLPQVEPESPVPLRSLRRLLAPYDRMLSR